MTGIELVLDFESLLPGMSVIITTGFLDNSEIKRSDSSNIVEILRKPYNADVLIEIINQTLHRA